MAKTINFYTIKLSHIYPFHLSTVIFLLISLLTSLLGIWPAQSMGMEMQVPFEEVAHTADLIFSGSVANQESYFNQAGNMILTDTYFEEVEVLFASPRSMQSRNSMIKITCAGGQVGDSEIKVPGTPEFIMDHRYLLFVLDDGKTYLNPLIGGHQGWFEIVNDEITGDDYPLTPGKKALYQTEDSELQKSASRIKRIRNGKSLLEEHSFLEKLSHPESPAGKNKKYLKAKSKDFNTSSETCTPVNMNGFRNYISNSLKKPLSAHNFKLGGGKGKLYQRQNNRIVPEDIKTSRRLRNNGLHAAQRVNSLTDGSISQLLTGDRSYTNGELYTCGYHELPLVMDQVPIEDWSYPINQDCIDTWNQFMDIYLTLEDDGDWGPNYQNEFCGWITDEELYLEYSFHWGSGLAACWTRRGFGEPTCGRIDESDVLCNAAYDWTDDPEFALGNSSVILLRPAVMHESGHSWGYQVSLGESYAYEQPSVMHGYYYNRVEDGWGIHAVDAYLFRRQYEDQTDILPITDVGIESYYALNGLVNSTADLTTYEPGQGMTVQNITVENMSDTAVSDMRVRFYLSGDREITTGDYPLGSYFSWSSYPAESHNVSDYTVIVPTDIPLGTYYIGGIITVNGFNDDDYLLNNTCSLYNTIEVTMASIFHLLHDEPVLFMAVPKDFYYEVSGTSWVGVAMDPNSDLDLQVDDSYDFDSPYEYSTAEGSVADFVVTNGILWGSTTHYARVYNGPPDEYKIEMEGPAHELSNTGSNYAACMETDEVFDLYEVELTAGTPYRVRLEIFGGNADLSLFMFSPARSSGNRDNYDWQLDAAGSGTTEEMIITADATGKYAIVVVNENNGNSTYTISTGPYEPNGDANNDHKVNLEDYALLARHWLDVCTLPHWCEFTDFDLNGEVDEQELLLLAENWLAGGQFECEATFLSFGPRDGRVWDQNGQQTGSGFNDDAVDSQALRLGDVYLSPNNYTYKNILSFDTSLLPDEFTIVSANLELTQGYSDGTNPFGWGGNCVIDADNILGATAQVEASDWEASVAANNIAQFLTAPAFNGDTMVSTDFSSEGLNLINSLSNVQFRISFETATNNNTTSDYLGFYSGDYPGSEFSVPRLTVHYLGPYSVATFYSIANEDGRVWDQNGSGSGINFDADDSNNQALRLGDFYGSSIQYSYKTILSFDTSYLPDDCTVIGAYLQITRGAAVGVSPFIWGGDCLVDIDTGFSGDPVLEASDWQSAAAGIAIAEFISDPGEDQPMTSTVFNPTGLNAVNLLGRTQLRIYFSTPQNNDSVTDFLGFYAAENLPADQRPALVIQYTPAN
ncbi:MAG: hypothetical protein JW860_05825 [Sedimentisphaerales bacterium]|nr:hypothetical protein [Sedimentisphaerales bacterium]